jgi:hypothetical protein
MDVVKLTLNANAASYVPLNSSEKKPEVTHKARLNKLKEMLGVTDLFPLGSINSTSMMTAGKFPHALNLVIKYAAELAMEGRKDLRFQPLTSFTYSDGQTMLTVTGLLIENDLVDCFHSKTGIDRWSLSNTHWDVPKVIDIPNLTLRERLYIDSLLPQFSAEEIQKKLDFLFDKKEGKSVKMIDNYSNFYRQSPHFSRIIF